MKWFLLLACLITSTCLAQKPVVYTTFDAAVSKTQMPADFLNIELTANDLITNNGNSEYIFRDVNYIRGGNKIVFKPDGTYEGKYHVRCGGDRMRGYSNGFYKMLSEDYICFSLSNGRSQKSDISLNNNLDLGVYRVYKTDCVMRLLKSDGNPEKDKLILEYIEMLDAKQNDVKLRRMDSVYKPNELLALLKEHKTINGYEILYHKGELTLVKVGNTFKYILSTPNDYVDGLNRDVIQTVMFKDSLFTNLDRYILEIDSKEDKLSQTNFEDTTQNSFYPNQKNNISVFRSKKNIVKIKCTTEEYTVSYYLKMGNPFFVKVDDFNNYQYSFYVYNWNEGLQLTKAQQQYPFSTYKDIYNHLNEIINKTTSSR